MQFIDEVQIEVKAGKGGAGSVHWRREKFEPMGGPDGGNGGAGGSVILIADRNKHTLLDFKFQPRWHADDGKPGEGARKDGKFGDDLTITVPVGTQIYNTADDSLVADLTEDGQRFVLAQGGRGGRGNTFFKSATNRAPDHAQPGEEGVSGIFRFSLKLVADVGLVGFPNAGKSTFISRVSAARPKIADYPFTTLTPNLGVTKSKSGRSFVIADIPGLIPGAHTGKGLGIQFLKHIERTGVLLHLIDPLQIDDAGEPVPALESYKILRNELEQFSPELLAKPQLVALTKADAFPDSDELDATCQQFKEQGISCIAISSLRGDRLEDLLELLVTYL